MGSHATESAAGWCQYKFRGCVAWGRGEQWRGAFQGRILTKQQIYEEVWGEDYKIIAFSCDGISFVGQKCKGEKEHEKKMDILSGGVSVADADVFV